MNAKKYKTALLALILLAGSFFIASAENNSIQYIVKTQYFDIIYKAPSRETAKLISENVDQIYLDVRNSLKVENFYHFKNFPVYIEYNTEELNAYFTDYPFRHITVYDTVATDSLSVYKENILSVLQHEIVHAVSMNVKNKGNQILSQIIYNGWGFSFYTMPSSISEGIAVQKESESGQGRLNDPYSTHIIKQALIENKFPAFQNITGSRDIFPSGNLPYIFGGAFTDFVIKKYGKEKYQLFLYELNNKLLNYYVSYEKVFGTAFKSDYEEFKDMIVIPDVEKTPYDEEGIEDFYTLFKVSEQKKYSQKKTTGVTEVSSFITEEESGSAWLCSDSGDVWYSSKELCASGYVPSKPVKLFTMTGITKLSFSSDGKYLAVSRTVSYNTRTNVVSIYDMKNKKFFKLGEDYRDATVLSKNGTYYAVAVKTVSQNCSLEFFKISDKGKFEHEKTINLKSGEIPSSLNDAGNLTLSFIYKEGLKRSISLYNKELDQFNSVDLPSDIFIRDLAPVVSKSFVTGQQGIVLSFSYARKDTLPRLGFLSVRMDNEQFSTAKLHLLINDISGGVYSPAVYFSSQSLKLPSVIFVSQFYDNSKLSVMDTDKFDFEQINVSVQKDERFNNYKQLGEVTIENEKRFSGFNYAFHGIFVPLSLIPLYDEDFNLKYMGFAGITWHSKGYHISAGYEPFTNSWGATLSIFNSSPTENGSFQLSGHVAFDQYGFRQTEDELIFEYQIPVGNHSHLFFSSSTRYFTGHPEKWTWQSENYARNVSLTSFVNQEVFEISTLHKTGAGINEVGGVYLGSVFNYTKLDSNIKGYKGEGINLGLETGFKLPYLIPFENPENVTLNLPFSASFAIFPNISKFMNCKASVVLFAMEVQQGTERFFFPLYLNRFTVTASYSGSLYYSNKINMTIANLDMLEAGLLNSVYTDSISLGFEMGITINTGFLQQLEVLNIGADLIFDINQRFPDNNRIHLKLCSQLVF